MAGPSPRPAWRFVPAALLSANPCPSLLAQCCLPCTHPAQATSRAGPPARATSGRPPPTCRPPASWRRWREPTRRVRPAQLLAWGLVEGCAALLAGSLSPYLLKSLALPMGICPAQPVQLPFQGRFTQASLLPMLKSHLAPPAPCFRPPARLDHRRTGGGCVPAAAPRRHHRHGEATCGQRLPQAPGGRWVVLARCVRCAPRAVLRLAHSLQSSTPAWHAHLHRIAPAAPAANRGMLKPGECASPQA